MKAEKIALTTENLPNGVHTPDSGLEDLLREAWQEFSDRDYVLACLGEGWSYSLQDGDRACIMIKAHDVDIACIERDAEGSVVIFIEEPFVREKNKILFMLFALIHIVMECRKMDEKRKKREQEEALYRDQFDLIRKIRIPQDIIYDRYFRADL